MKNIVDTYLGNLSSKSKKEIIAAQNKLGNGDIKNGKIDKLDKFLTVEQARDLVKKFEIKLYGVVSLGSWFHNGEYISENGIFGEINENNPEDFFITINRARFEIAEYKIPKNEFRYAMIGGDFPDKLVTYLHKYRYLFDGVKIGAFRSKTFEFNDPKYIALREFCQSRSLSVLVHCKSNNPQNFIDLYNLSEKYKKVKICASHIGGEDETLFNNRANFLLEKKTLAPNFFINLAIQDIELISIFLDKIPGIINHIIFCSDHPFLGDYNSIIQRTKKVFTNEQIEIIMNNSKSFLNKVKLDN